MNDNKKIPVKANKKYPRKCCESRCRNVNNIYEYYLTELNGINLIIKIIILSIFFKIIIKNKTTNKLILILLLILTVQVFIHLIIIIMSLPFLCDSSNFNWKYADKPGNPISILIIFCNLKYRLYYSNVFWFFDSVLPNIFLLIISYYILQKGFLN